MPSHGHPCARLPTWRPSGCAVGIADYTAPYLTWRRTPRRGLLLPVPIGGEWRKRKLNLIESISAPAIERIMKAKRVLIITKTDPSHPLDGGTIRVAQIREQLEVNGVDVRVVPIRRDPRGARPRGIHGGNRYGFLVLLRAMLSGSPSVIRWFSFSSAKEIKQVWREFAPEVLLVEYSQLAPYAHFWPGKTVFDLHNIEHELVWNYSISASSRWRRWAARIDASLLRRHEKKLAKARKPTFLVSEHDRSVWASLGGDLDLAGVAPNGVSGGAFELTRSPAAPPLFVFIGHLGWQPNVDAAEWLVHEVYPYLKRACAGARVALVGRSPAPAVRVLGRIEGVAVHGDVASTLPYLAEATAATAPLLSAGGTRLKILEALGTGTPVVSTSLGALGLEDLVEEGRLIVADSPMEFAHRLADLVNDRRPESTIRMAAARYRWENTLAPLVNEILSHGPHGAGPGGHTAGTPDD